MGVEGDLANVMRLMYHRGLVQVRGGNASVVDRARGLVYITPTGKPRSLIEEGDIAIITLDGNIIKGEPSSEWRMHIAIYREIGEAKAIVHGHPRNAVLIGEVGLKPDPTILGEAAYTSKCIALVPYRRPGTWELAHAVALALRESGCRAAIMRRHGAVAYSEETIYHALDTLEALEDLSYIQVHLNNVYRASEYKT